jgi:hypothetical protein
MVGLVIASTTIAAAEPLRCSIIADDFEPRMSRVTRIDDAGLQFVDNTTGATGTMPLDRLVRLESFPGPEAKAKAAVPAMGFVILFRDGQRWMGTPGAMAGDDLEWNAVDIFGKGDSPSATGRVALKSIVAIASIKNASAADLDRSASSTTASTQDELRLTNGDVVSGVVSASDAKTVTCATADGQPVTIDWTNVRVAKFAAVSDAAVASRRAPFRVALRDGRIIDGERLAADGEQIDFFTAHGGKLSLTGGTNIVAIEHTGGRVQMLSNMLPADRLQSSYFPSPWTSPGKITETRSTAVVFPGRTFRSSVLARPRSSMRWALDGSAKIFVTRYGIPAGRPLADVKIRVKLDEKVVYEQSHVKAGAPSALLKLPLGDAKSLTLEVDYGDAYDVQDDFYWLEPALLAP